jgi:hypothetical protein
MAALRKTATMSTILESMERRKTDDEHGIMHSTHWK